MASVLVIGIGSTGFNVIEQSIQFYYEFKKAYPNNNRIAYMFLDTATQSSTTIDKGIVKYCDISTANVAATLNGWQGIGKTEYMNWLPTQANILDAHNGAGGQPVYGRLGLWANESKVANQISTLYNRIGGNGDTNIYIVGSLVGGTGTGVCLDIAYMVRQITANNNIYGMFLLPDRQGNGQTTKAIMYENAYTSLKSIDYYSKSNNNESWYDCVMPSGREISFKGAPYKQVQYFTQDFSDATASLPQLSSLVQIVGFDLVLRVLDVDNTNAPFQNLVDSRMIDLQQTAPNSIFSTIGINVFQYPEALLEEYFAIERLKEEILNRWYDQQYYINEVGTSLTITNLISTLGREAESKLQESILSSIDACRGNKVFGFSTFKQSIENDCSYILEGKWKNNYLSLDHFIFSLLDSKNSDKYYAAIKGLEIDLRNKIVEALADYIEKISSKYQNLRVVKETMICISKSIDNILKEWKIRYSIDGSPTQWNAVWGDKILPSRFHESFPYKATMTSKQYYEEAIDGSIQLCFFNILYDVLIGIKKSINGDGITAITTPVGIQLPTQKDVDEIIAKVNTLLDTNNDNSVIERGNLIEGQLGGNVSTQINFLYQNDTFKEDVRTARGKYTNDNKKLTFDKISGQSVYTYLKTNSENELKTDMITKSLQFIQGLNLFGNSNIVKIMQNLPSSSAMYNKVNTLLTQIPDLIKETLPAMCKMVTTEQFQEHQCLKLIVATDKESTDAVGIVAAMKGYKPSQTGSNFVCLPSMKNTVVVYQEYSYLGTNANGPKCFNPLIHLDYQNNVRQSIANQGDRFNDSGLRLAYIDSVKTLLDSNNIKIK
jgi:hypothetical protein